MFTIQVGSWFYHSIFQHVINEHTSQAQYMRLSLCLVRIQAEIKPDLEHGRDMVPLKKTRDGLRTTSIIGDYANILRLVHVRLMRGARRAAHTLPLDQTQTLG